MVCTMTGGKVSPWALTKRTKEALRKELERACECIRTHKDFPLFLDLLTESEWIMLARRILVAKRLIAGHVPYVIQRDLKVGQATVTSIDQLLKSRFEEYRKTLPSLYEELYEKAREERRKRPIEPTSFRWLRRKYPLHFLLFNMLLDDINWKKGSSSRHRPKPYTPLKGEQRKRRR